MEAESLFCQKSLFVHHLHMTLLLKLEKQIQTMQAAEPHARGAEGAGGQD